MSPDGPTLGSVSCECVNCTVRTADRIDEALSVILSQTWRCRSRLKMDRGQTMTSLTVSGPTVVRKGLPEHLNRPRNDSKVGPVDDLLLPSHSHVPNPDDVNDTVDSPDSMDVDRTTNPRIQYQYVMIDERSFCSDG